MPREAMLGNRVRRLRTQEGLTQVAMAARLGISPSYLNLIEHNQRALNRPLLLKLADNFAVDIQSFSGNEEARLLAELKELFGDPLFGDLDLEDRELGDLVGAAPAACRAMLRLYQAYRALRDESEGMSARLAEDPFLASSSHQLLTLLTSIRSFAEILHDNTDLAASKRRQFVGVLVEESERLTGHVKELFDFITGEGLRGAGGVDSPADEVTNALHAARNHFPELEDAADAMSREIGLGEAPPRGRSGESLGEALGTALLARHGIAVSYTPCGDGGCAEEGFDPEGRRLLLPETLAASSAAFRIARRIGLLSHGDLLARKADETALSGPEARDLYRGVLASYFAAALIMPYDRFLGCAQELRHDIELIGQRFGASFEQVCHRLTTLQKPGAEGVPFHFLKVDIAGNITKRYSGSGLRIPRFGGACPRWNVHAAFMRPGTIDRQLAQLTDGSTYFSIAKALARPDGGYRTPQSYYAVSLGCEVSFARQLVYADGIDLERSDLAVPVGVHCRLCERSDCRQRAFPALMRRAKGVAAPGGGPA